MPAMSLFAAGKVCNNRAKSATSGNRNMSGSKHWHRLLLLAAVLPACAAEAQVEELVITAQRPSEVTVAV